jgi:tRNA A-37 threonylcarbamoyl transferase component Bud32
MEAFMEDALSPGALLQERYRIQGIVGEGATGVVYEADDLTIPGARWAIKEIRDDRLSPDERQDALELFHRESALLSRLNHTGLPKIIESFTTGDRHYTVMEFIEGESLHTKFTHRKGPFEPHQILPWIFQVLDILEYLHSQIPPVIFRDLKPSNIVITAGGKAKLIDFGIARLFQSGKMQDTQVMGTPGFSAPEQYGTGQTDARSDLYALGATMFLLLSGQDPEKFGFQFPPLESCSDKIPPWLSLTVSKALEKEPAQRFQSAEEMKCAMHLGLDGDKAPPLPGAAQPPGPWTVIRRSIADLVQEPWRAWGYCMVLVLCSFIPCVGGIMSIPGYLGLALLALMSFFMIIYHLAKKDLSRALSSMGVVAASLGVLAIPMLILSSAFTGTRGSDNLQTCRANLKEIAAAVDLYEVSSGKIPPSSLSNLTPTYLKTIPTCPGARRDTYSTSYASSAESRQYTLFCRGSHHRGLRPDYPRYTSLQGLVVDPGDL